MMSRPSVLMVGTGEYTTGYVHDGASGSDKSAGVVSLSLFDMRRRGVWLRPRLIASLYLPIRNRSSSIS